MAARLRRWLLGLATAGLLVAAGPAAADSAADLFAGFQSKSKDPIQVDAKTLEIFEQDKQRISVFSGNVTVRRGDTILKATTIKLFSDSAAKATSSSAFTRMEASGTVYVNSGDQTVTGNNAVVDMKAQTITMTGDVVLSQGTSVLTGDRLVVNLATGRAKLDQAPGKRIQGVFTPDDNKTPGSKAPGATP